MKISYNWLKQYLDINLAPAKVAEILTDIGLEVEHVEEWESIKGGLQGIVVGEVKTKEKHPEADRLSITTVDVGGPALLNIVCGAANVASGQKVLVATTGATLYPTTGEPFTIKKSKIRGAASEGMICAEDEIGLGKSHEGIMVLDPTAIVGTPAATFFQLEKDAIFEIGLTPNRADAASHMGVARDLAAYLNASKAEEAHAVELKTPIKHGFKADDQAQPFTVGIESAESCIRYSGILMTGIQASPSPQWLQTKLAAIGLKSISALVDIGNFVMHELGQPLHFFDADKIHDHKVSVRKLSGPSQLVTLDGEERKLQAGDLVIADGQGPMCLAGVFGGLASGISETTTAVFIESACFNPGDVRKTSKHHALKTDASFRFERGTDPDMTVPALLRAIELVKEITGGKTVADIIDIYPQPVEPTKVAFSYKNLDAIAGITIDPKTVKTILVALGIQILTEGTDALLLGVPAFKVDVKREIDVIEEVLRIYGYNAIPIPHTVKSSMPAHPVETEIEKNRVALTEMLTSLGYNEILTNSLTKGTYYQDLIHFPSSNSVSLLNPLSAELNVMRQSLVPNGLEVIAYNINRKSPNLKLYEFGKVYGNALEGSFREQYKVGIFITGKQEQEQWNTKYGEVDFSTIKGLTDAILQKSGLVNINTQSYEDDFIGQGVEITHPVLKLEHRILHFGKIKRHWLKTFDIKQDVYYAEIAWEHFHQALASRKLKIKELPKFPSITRDLALLIDKTIAFEQLQKIAFSVERKLLKTVQLVDVYEGEKIPAGKKSYALRFTLQDENETLTSGKIDTIIEKITMAMGEKAGADLRQ